MRTSTIYEVAIHHIGTLNTLRKRESSYVYFSNLKRAIESVQATLAINGWPQRKVNYTAVYRTFQLKEKFVCDFDFSGSKFFQLVIIKRTLNPILNTLGIDEMPTINKTKNT